MKRLVLGIAAALLAVSAQAADMAVKAPPTAPSMFSATRCTLTSCTGFYGGGFLTEDGSNINVLSGGLNGLSTNQFGIGLDAGWQFWNDKWFLAAEVTGSYSIIRNGTVPGGGNSALWGFGAYAKIGYNLLQTIAAANGASLPAGIGVIAPYAILGDYTRPWGSGFATGGGIEGLLTTNITLSADIIHVDYNNVLINPNVKQQTEDMVIAKIDYHF